VIKEPRLPNEHFNFILNSFAQTAWQTGSGTKHGIRFTGFVYEFVRQRKWSHCNFATWSSVWNARGDIKRRWTVMDYSCRQESKSSHPRNHSRPTNGCKWCLVGLLPIQFGHSWQRQSFSRRGKLTGTTSELSAHVVRFPRFLSCRKIPSPNQVEWSHRVTGVIVISKKASWVAFSPSPDSFTGILWQLRPATTSSAYSTHVRVKLGLSKFGSHLDNWFVAGDQRKRERERLMSPPCGSAELLFDEL